MKTLDEVIKAWEICHSEVGDCDECPYQDNCEREIDDDVLHYLKEYRKHLIQDLDELRQRKYELEFNNRHSKESSWDKDIQYEEFLRESQERGRQGIYG